MRCSTWWGCKSRNARCAPTRWACGSVLALAAALLGDPRVIVLDEPANGLDPDGIRWLRGLLRYLADQGRTVLVSSHQLNEVQEIAERVVILNHGQLVRAGSIAELTEGTDSVLVRSPNMDRLRAALAGQHITVEAAAPDALRIRGLTTAQVGHLAFEAGIELHELDGQRFDLEDLFFALTHGEHPQPTSPCRAGPAGMGDPAGPRGFVKLRTTQVWFWLLLAALALASFLTIGPIASGAIKDSGDLADLFAGAATSYLPVFVLGVLGVTTEYRHQTITPAVLATPARWALVTAKMITYLLVGAAYAALCVLVQLAISVPWLSAKDIDVTLGSNQVPRALVSVFAVVGVFGIVGIGVGALVKNQIVAVSVGIIVIQVVNPLLGDDPEGPRGLSVHAVRRAQRSAQQRHQRRGRLYPVATLGRCGRPRTLGLHPRRHRRRVHDEPRHHLGGRCFSLRGGRLCCWSFGRMLLWDRDFVVGLSGDAGRRRGRRTCSGQPSGYVSRGWRRGRFTGCCIGSVIGCFPMRCSRICSPMWAAVRCRR